MSAHHLLLATALLTACTSGSVKGADDDDEGSTGGALPEETFAREYAVAVCSWYQDCGLLVDAYEDWDSCIQQYEDAMLTFVTQAACDYDDEAAYDCVEEVDQVDCGEGGYSWSDESRCQVMCGE